LCFAKPNPLAFAKALTESRRVSTVGNGLPGIGGFGIASRAGDEEILGDEDLISSGDGGRLDGSRGGE
jgi:hypothetical protein